MFEQFKEIANHPQVVSAIRLFIAFYVLRDIVRAIVYIFTRALDSRRRHNKREEKNSERLPAGRSHRQRL